MIFTCRFLTIVGQHTISMATGPNVSMGTSYDTGIAKRDNKTDPCLVVGTYTCSDARTYIPQGTANVSTELTMTNW